MSTVDNGVYSPVWQSAQRLAYRVLADASGGLGDAAGDELVQRYARLVYEGRHGEATGALHDVRRRGSLVRAMVAAGLPLDRASALAAGAPRVAASAARVGVCPMVAGASRRSRAELLAEVDRESAMVRDWMRAEAARVGVLTAAGRPGARLPLWLREERRAADRARRAVLDAASTPEALAEGMREIEAKVLGAQSAARRYRWRVEHGFAAVLPASMRMPVKTEGGRRVLL